MTSRQPSRKRNGAKSTSITRQMRNIKALHLKSFFLCVENSKVRKAESMIELSHIQKVYPGNPPVEALKDISLHIAKGEIYGIIGQSGAGKSTLIRCINLLERPTSGEVIVDGVDLMKLDEKGLRAARKDIGMIFQHFNLLSSRTVYDNVAFPLELQGMSKEEIKKRVEPLLDLVQLTDRKDNYPAQLSGGQKQRVGIARALASEPKVLLCDEATSALDPQTTQSILELLKDINRRMGLTIVIITHEMQVIKEICDKVAVIEGGHIVESGSVLEVFTNPQEPTTREFIGSILPQSLPDEARNHLKVVDEKTPGAYPVVRLTFTGNVTDEPVVAGLVRRFGINVSIMYGGVDYIQEVSFGRLIIVLEGAEDKIEEALAYIDNLHIGSEVIGYVANSSID